jgi:hypothetical protein
MSALTEDGYEARDLAAGRVVALPDRPPVARIASPDVDLVATSEMEIPIRIEAEDDLRLAEAGVSLWRNGTPVGSRVLLAEPRAARIAEATLISLKSLGAKAGDTIDYAAFARDTNPAQGSRSTSVRRRIFVVSSSSYQRALDAAAGTPKSGNGRARLLPSRGAGPLPAELAAKLGPGLSTSGTQKAARATGGAALAGNETEVANRTASRKSTATSGAARGYPDEYRQLVNDYFRAVAEGR